MTHPDRNRDDAPVNMMEMIHVEPLDIVAVERRARELRAQAFAQGLRAAVRFVLRRDAEASPRTPATGQTA